MNEKVEIYTLDEHCKNLLKMLKQPNPCKRCPAGSSDLTGNNPDFCRWENLQCDVCKDFVDCNHISDWMCPCSILGREECIKRTWINLEEKGYI